MKTIHPIILSNLITRTAHAELSVFYAITDRPDDGA